MKTPAELRYTKEHEWINPANGKMGISDFAQDQLGDVVYLDFTVAVGDDIEAGQVLGTIESVKTVSDIYAPINGKVTGINEYLADTPELVNHDPYDKGWLLSIEPANSADVDALLSAEAYGAQIK